MPTAGSNSCARSSCDPAVNEAADRPDNGGVRYQGAYAKVQRQNEGAAEPTNEITAPNAALVAAADETEMSTPQIAQAINVLVRKYEQAQVKAEQYERTMGQHLKVLKERKPGDIDWEAWLEECKVKLKQDRADQLIRIADGRTTADKVRADTAERNRRLRKRKSLSRDSEQVGEETDIPLVSTTALQPAQQPTSDPAARFEAVTTDPTTKQPLQGEPPAPAEPVDVATALLRVKRSVQDCEHGMAAAERREFGQALLKWAKEKVAEVKNQEKAAEREAKKANRATQRQATKASKRTAYLANITANMTETEKAAVAAADVEEDKSYSAYEATMAELDTVFGSIYGGGINSFGERERGRLAEYRCRHAKKGIEQSSSRKTTAGAVRNAHQARNERCSY
jgi:hypothetical protein